MVLFLHEEACVDDPPHTTLVGYHLEKPENIRNQNMEKDQ